MPGRSTEIGPAAQRVLARLQDQISDGRLRPGARLAGPAIVEERESTLVVAPGQLVTVMPELSLEVTREGR